MRLAPVNPPASPLYEQSHFLLAAACTSVHVQVFGSFSQAQPAKLGSCAIMINRLGLDLYLTWH